MSEYDYNGKVARPQLSIRTRRPANKSSSFEFRSFLREAEVIELDLACYDKEYAYGPALGLPVLVLMVTTSILGPVLTEHFAPRLLKDVTRCRQP